PREERGVRVRGLAMGGRGGDAAGGRARADRPPVPRGQGVRRGARQGVSRSRFFVSQRRRLRGLPDSAGVDQAGGVTGRGKGPRGDSEARLQQRLRQLQGGSRWLPERPQDADVPVAGQQEGDRLARGAGPREAAVPHAAVESAMRALLRALSWGGLWAAVWLIAAPGAEA